MKRRISIINKNNKNQHYQHQHRHYQHYHHHHHHRHPIICNYYFQERYSVSISASAHPTTVISSPSLLIQQSLVKDFHCISNNANNNNNNNNNNYCYCNFNHYSIRRTLNIWNLIYYYSLIFPFISTSSTLTSSVKAFSTVSLPFIRKPPSLSKMTTKTASSTTELSFSISSILRKNNHDNGNDHDDKKHHQQPQLIPLRRSLRLIQHQQQQMTPQKISDAGDDSDIPSFIPTADDDDGITKNDMNVIPMTPIQKRTTKTTKTTTTTTTTRRRSTRVRGTPKATTTTSDDTADTLITTSTSTTAAAAAIPVTPDGGSTEEDENEQEASSLSSDSSSATIKTSTSTAPKTRKTKAKAATLTKKKPKKNKTPVVTNNKRSLSTTTTTAASTPASTTAESTQAKTATATSTTTTKSPLKKKQKVQAVSPATKAKNDNASSTTSTSPTNNNNPYSIPPPKNWESIYTLVEELRQDRTAPVDTDGSEALPQGKDTNPPMYRYQVLIALMLSSQTKDAIVGESMRTLQEYGLTVSNIVKLQDTPEVLNRMIYKVGFHNNKTKYILETTKVLQDQYNGDIPTTAQELMTLPGIGPKMAFIIENVAWGTCSGIGIDTHMHRMFNQLHWVKSPTKTPEQTRLQLESWLPIEYWPTVNVLWVGLGQEVQQFKPKLLQKALFQCSRPKEALQLLNKLGLNYRVEAKKAGWTEKLEEVLSSNKENEKEEEEQ